MLNTPSYSYDTADYTSSDVWTLIKTADAANYIMTAGTPGSSDSDENAVGLACSHLYSILAAYTVYDESGNFKANLLKMRNPWGVDGSYNGTWSDKDSIWNTGTYKT